MDGEEEGEAAEEEEEAIIVKRRKDLSEVIKRGRGRGRGGEDLPEAWEMGGG